MQMQTSGQNTYRRFLKDGYYLDSEKDSGISKEAAKNLAEFNRLTSAGNFQKFNKVQATLAIEEARKNLIAKSKDRQKVTRDQQRRHSLYLKSITYGRKERRYSIYRRQKQDY